MEQHHRGQGSIFVKKYGVNRLVYLKNTRSTPTL